MKRVEELRAEILNKVSEYYAEAHLPAEFVAGVTPVRFGGRVFDSREMTNLISSALDFWLTSGDYAEKFEAAMCGFIGSRYCLFVNSGSSANLLAFMALTSAELRERRIERGDEVITVAAGFPTTVAPVIQYGAVPVFVDVTLPTYNVDCTQLEAAVGPRTKAVFLAHTLGNPFEVDFVRKFCDEHGLWLLEDNCDALGSAYGGARTGTFGDIATLSFYPAHHITTGEGGAVCTSDPLLARIVESLRDWGRDCFCPPGKDNTCGMRFGRKFGELPFGYDHKYVYSRFGYNLKATDLQAAIGLAQLEKLPDFIEARKRNFRLLIDALRPFEERLILPESTAKADPCWFGFPITVREGAGFDRADIVQYLESRLIHTRLLFAGNILKQPCFDEMRRKDSGYRVVGGLPNTDRVMNSTFWVGVYPGLSGAAMKYMADTFKEFLSR